MGGLEFTEQLDALTELCSRFPTRLTLGILPA